MPTFIKPQYWEKVKRSYKGWLNLESFIKDNSPTLDDVLTAGNSSSKEIQLEYLNGGVENNIIDNTGMNVSSTQGNASTQFQSNGILISTISTLDYIMLSKNIITSTFNISGDVNGFTSGDKLPVYADNLAAANGGLYQGDIYRTSTGVLMIRY